MNEPPHHPALQFVDSFKDLVEGRMEPADWLHWWEAHAAEVEVACPRGWFLRLKTPTDRSGFGINDSVWGSQQGAAYVLTALRVPFALSDRYKLARDQDVERVLAAAKEQKVARARQFNPRLNALAKHFPKFARFLKKHADDIDQLEEPATEAEILAAEQSVDASLPESLKQLLRSTRGLSRDGFAIGLAQIFPHPAVLSGRPAAVRTVCIADYWLEADGDQVVIAASPNPCEDVPVYYYGHATGVNTARELAGSLSAWLESLPRSSVFKR